MVKQKKKIDMPVIEPIYSTYHYQGPGTAIIVNNPSIRNWYLNEVMNLKCTRRFLDGYTSPEMDIVNSSWNANPYFLKVWYRMEYIDGYVHYIIRKFLDQGFYVCFSKIDDYYVEGKSWYQERHFNHDGCICGYDPSNDTYCIYAYDKNWVYQKFWTPKKAFERGRKSAFKQEEYGLICGIKPKEETVTFCHKTALEKIEEYLSSDLENYPETEGGPVYGTAVHDYICKYLDRLYDGSIPHDRMDRRIFRIIWEQKKVMLERIALIEDALSIDHSISKRYQEVVRDADNCRMLYASHHMKQRNSVLPIIQKKLLALKNKEQALLTELLEKSKEAEK